MRGVDLVKARGVSFFASEQLHGRHSGDVLLQERVDARDPRPHGAIGLAYVRAEPLGDHGDQRQHDEAGQGQTPVHAEHHDHDPGQREDVAEDGDDAGREQLVEHVDVACHPRHQPADRVAVVEAQVQPLQVRVQLHPQVVHDALAGQLHHPGLHVLERERTGQDRQVDPRDVHQSTQIAGWDVRVDDQLGQVRRGQLQHRVRDDGRKRHQHRSPVRPQITQQPPHETAVVGFADDVVVLHT